MLEREKAAVENSRPSSDASRHLSYKPKVTQPAYVPQPYTDYKAHIPLKPVAVKPNPQLIGNSPQGRKSSLAGIVETSSGYGQGKSLNRIGGLPDSTRQNVRRSYDSFQTQITASTNETKIKRNERARSSHQTLVV